MKDIDFTNLEKHLNNLIKNIDDINRDLQEKKQIIEALYIELRRKAKIINEYENRERSNKKD